jgi:hypothetical protein
MQLQQNISCLAWVLGLAAAVSLGCRDGEDTGPGIDYGDLVEVQPDAEPPKIKFPAECQQEDRSLNEFVTRVLGICQRGGYDDFCNLFSISEVPPSHDEFKKIWSGVGEIAVRSIHMAPVRPDDPAPAQYFVHAVVKLRREDARKRLERDVVVRVFKEMDQWRISGAPKEIVRKVLIADTQPASAPASRPNAVAGALSAAPSSAPAVYKDKSPGS